MTDTHPDSYQFPVETEGLDAAIEWLADCGQNYRYAVFGCWQISCRTGAATHIMNIILYRRESHSPESMAWERYRDQCVASDLPDVVRRIFLQACSNEFPRRFAGDPFP